MVARFRVNMIIWSGRQQFTLRVYYSREDTCDPILTLCVKDYGKNPNLEELEIGLAKRWCYDR